MHMKPMDFHHFRFFCTSLMSKNAHKTNGFSSFLVFCTSLVSKRAHKTIGFSTFLNFLYLSDELLLVAICYNFSGVKKRPCVRPKMDVLEHFLVDREQVLKMALPGDPNVRSIMF